MGDEQALLLLLALGNRAIERGETKPARDVLDRLRSKTMTTGAVTDPDRRLEAPKPFTLG